MFVVLIEQSTKILLHEEIYILYLLHYVDNEWKWLERVNGIQEKAKVATLT
jgi:hypothetical protein